MSGSSYSGGDICNNSDGTCGESGGGGDGDEENGSGGDVKDSGGGGKTKRV